LPQLRKKDVGLPHYDDANAQQRDEQMCWQEEGELYNKGNAVQNHCP